MPIPVQQHPGLAHLGGDAAERDHCSPEEGRVAAHLGRGHARTQEETVAAERQESHARAHDHAPP